MNLDAIEEVRGSDTSILSFVAMGDEGQRKREETDEFKREDMRIEVRESEISPSSEETFDYRRGSNDELIEEADVGMAVPYKQHPVRSSW